MTSAEQQQTQRELEELRTYLRDRREAIKNIQRSNAELNNNPPHYSQEAKAQLRHTIETEKERINQIDRAAQERYRVTAGAYSKYTLKDAIREREEVLGIQPQEREPIQSTVRGQQQPADQRAGQPLTDEQIVKKMYDLEKSVRDGMQIQQSERAMPVLKGNAQQYLNNQLNDARSELVRMAQEHPKAYALYSGMGHTFPALTPDQMIAQAKQIDTAAYKREFTEKTSRSEQKEIGSEQKRNRGGKP
jgi:hypothetical protein